VAEFLPLCQTGIDIVEDVKVTLPSDEKKCLVRECIFMEPLKGRGGEKKN